MQNSLRRPSDHGPYADELDTLALFGQLISLLRQVLVPVQPSVTFRANLRQDLAAAAYERQRLGQDSRKRNWLTSPWTLAVAAIGSGLSVAIGIITYVIWHRWRTAAG